MPPSTSTIWPVMYRLRTTASTASAQSSGVADRFMGAILAMASCCASQSAVHGVATRPGAPAFHGTRFRHHAVLRERGDGEELVHRPAAGAEDARACHRVAMRLADGLAQHRL